MIHAFWTAVGIIAAVFVINALDVHVDINDQPGPVQPPYVQSIQYPQVQTPNLQYFQQPVQPAATTPAQVPTSIQWQCPVATTGGLCIVSNETQLVAGLCVDFDPRSTAVEGNGVIVSDTGLSARAKVTGNAVYTGPFPATVYKDPICQAPMGVSS